MTCERCQLIEDEYVKVEAEGLTRDALMLAVAALRSEVAVQCGVYARWRTQHENLLACAAADQRALLRVSRAAKAFRDWDAIGALLSGDEPHAEDAQNDLRELDAALSRVEYLMQARRTLARALNGEET